MNISLIIAISLSIVLGLLYVVLNILYRHSESYRNRNVTKRRFFDGVPNNLKVVNFGSNYMMYAFDNYRELNISGFNFSMPAQSLEIDEALLHQYSSHFSKGCIVIFGVAACVPFYGFSYCNDPEKYYDIIKSRYLPSWNLKYTLKAFFPLRLKQWRLVKGLIYKEGPITDISAFTKQIEDDASCKKAMNNYALGWQNMFHFKSLKQTDFDKDQLESLNKNTIVLKRMFSFCKEKGFIPVVLIPPFGKELNQYYSEDFISASLKKCLKQAGQDVPVFDYRTHSSFQEHPNLFFDGAFSLNKRGSLKMMKLFFEELKNNNIIKSYQDLYK